MYWRRFYRPIGYGYFRILPEISDPRRCTKGSRPLGRRFDGFWLYKWHSSLTFTLRFLSSHLFSLFLPLFFSLAGHLVGFILLGKAFRKAFRILGLDEMKVGGWWNKIFMDIFRSMLPWWFIAFFSNVLDWKVLILVWFERSLHSAQVSGQSYPWPLKRMTSQAVERTWILTGG